MEALLILLAIPLVWPFIAKRIWEAELTLGELGINIAVGVAVTVAGWYLGHYMQMADRQILNGQLTSKSVDRVSCEHSYSCNCTETCSGTGTSRSCTTVCQTCYEHTWDYDYTLHSDIGKVTVDRVDRQGLQEPARYTAAQVGEPFSLADSYENYIKAAPHSLFHHLEDSDLKARYGADIPAYPDQVYDYHRVNRVLPVKVTVPDISRWNELLSQELKVLGPIKQVNVVVITSHDKRFADALHNAWLGGKKNDVIVVLGSKNYPQIDWVSVTSWTDNSVFNVQLRDALFDLQKASPDAVTQTIAKHVAKSYVRKHMKDFSYLKDDIELSVGTWLALILVSAGSSVGLSIFLSNNSIRYRYGYRR